MKCFLLLWWLLLVANVQGLRIGEEYLSDFFPFDVDYEDWADEDAVRQKRDPLSIVLTLENDKCGMETDPKNFGSEKIIIPSGSKDGSSKSPSPQQEVIVKACKCKKKPASLTVNPSKRPPTYRQPPKKPAPPVNPPKVPPPPVYPPKSVPIPKEPPKIPEPHETKPMDPFHALPQESEYSPKLTGRFFADDSIEYLHNSKKLASMDSEELLNGKYAEPSTIWDQQFKQSPMATYTSKQWTTNPFAQLPTYHTAAPPSHPKEFPPQQIQQIQYKAPNYDVAKLIEILQSNPQYACGLGDYDKEWQIIHRINSQYDLSHSQSEYEQQELTRKAVLDYIKSKYYLRNSKSNQMSSPKIIVTQSHHY